MRRDRGKQNKTKNAFKKPLTNISKSVLLGNFTFIFPLKDMIIQKKLSYRLQSILYSCSRPLKHRIDML